jgi:5-methylcytosine-specific restriction endonuclease McrA
MKPLVNGPESKAALAHARRNARAERFLALCPLFLINGVGLAETYARRLRRNGVDAPLSPRSARIRNAVAPLARYILEVRDKSTCALCAAQGKVRLAVHHIVPVEVEWARVGDPTNLISLCLRCHLDRAHAGSWFTLDPDLGPKLHRIAADREDCQATPLGLLRVVQKRLAILGRELGRA